MGKGIYDFVKITDLKDMLKKSEKAYGDKEAFRFKTKEPGKFRDILYKEFASQVNALGTSLINLNLKDKRVAVISENRYEWAVAYLAVVCGTGVVVPMDKSLPENEIKSLIERSEVDAIIYSKAYDSIMKEVKKEGNTNLKYLISMDLEKEEDKVLSQKELIEKGEKLIKGGDKRFVNAKIDREKMSIMLFTSGTTAKSKAVALSHKNLCTNIQDIASMFDIGVNDRMLSFLPLHHTFECTATYLFCFFIGFNICYCDGLKHIQKNLVEYNISGMVCVPAVLDVMYRQIWKTIRQKKLEIPMKMLIAFSNFLRFFHIDLRKKLFKSVLEPLGGRLRTIIYGSASADPKVIKFFNSIGVRMIQGYGLTETSPVISCESDKYQKVGSAGRPLFCEDVQIIDKDENGIGEIIVKGPNVMLGYYENSDATKEVLVDGYFHTGDLGYIDKQGFLFVTGRKKDMIVLKNGKKIFPQELELLLNESSLIEESFVYPSPTEVDKLCTKLVYKADNTAFKGKTKKEIYELLKQEVKNVNLQTPTYKNIRDVKITTEPLIKTTTQKIKRHEEIKKILD